MVRTWNCHSRRYQVTEVHWSVTWQQWRATGRHYTWLKGLLSQSASQHIIKHHTNIKTLMFSICNHKYGECAVTGNCPILSVLDIFFYKTMIHSEISWMNKLRNLNIKKRTHFFYKQGKSRNKGQLIFSDPLSWNRAFKYLKR